MDISLYYNPHRVFSHKVHFANDVLPKEYHEQYSGWTIDGAYDHRDRPDSPWNKIEELDLLNTIYFPIVEKHYQETLTELYRADIQFLRLVNEIKDLRKELRQQKKFDISDKLRNILSKFRIEVQDEKETSIKS